MRLVAAGESSWAACAADASSATRSSARAAIRTSRRYALAGIRPPSTALVRVARQPAESLERDRLEVGGGEHAAEAVGDRAEEAAADEDPRLGVRIAVGRNGATLLPFAQRSRDEVVHLAHVPADLTADDRVFPGLGEPL